MKSSHKNSPLSGAFSVFAVGLVAIIGFFTLGSSLPKQNTQEQVLGVSSHTAKVTRTFHGDKYVCNKPECDKVANGGGALSDDTDADMGNGPKCRSVKDSKKTSVCYWDNPILTAAQCNVDKSVYRNRGTDKGALNLYFSEDPENNVYYDCAKITPAPTKKPSPTPTRRPSPTPTVACARSYGQSCGASVSSKANCRDGYVGCLSGLKCIKHVGQSKYTCQKPVIIATPTPTKRAPSNVR